MHGLLPKSGRSVVISGAAVVVEDTYLEQSAHLKILIQKVVESSFQKRKTEKRTVKPHFAAFSSLAHQYEGPHVHGLPPITGRSVVVVVWQKSCV